MIEVLWFIVFVEFGINLTINRYLVMHLFIHELGHHFCFKIYIFALKVFLDLDVCEVTTIAVSVELILYQTDNVRIFYH